MVGYHSSFDKEPAALEIPRIIPAVSQTLLNCWKRLFDLEKPRGCRLSVFYYFPEESASLRFNVKAIKQNGSKDSLLVRTQARVMVL